MSERSEFKRSECERSESYTKKKIADMSKEEKDVIINELKSGGMSDYFELKQFKNGNCRLINKRKKQNEHSPIKIFKDDSSDKIEVASEEIKPKQIKSPKLTNEQFMLQSIMDIKSENAVLRTKLKKYKKRLNEFYITAEDEEVSIPAPNQEAQDEPQYEIANQQHEPQYEIANQQHEPQYEIANQTNNKPLYSRYSVRRR